MAPPRGERVRLVFPNGDWLSLGWVSNRGPDLVQLLRAWADREEHAHAAPTGGTDVPRPPEPEHEEDR